MRTETVTLPVIATVGDGSPVQVGDLREKWCQVQGYVSGTYHLEASVTGDPLEASEWTQVGPNITASGFIDFPETALWARIRTSVGGTAPTAVVVAGRNARTE